MSAFSYNAAPMRQIGEVRAEEEEKSFPVSPFFLGNTLQCIFPPPPPPFCTSLTTAGLHRLLCQFRRGGFPLSVAAIINVVVVVVPKVVFSLSSSFPSVPVRPRTSSFGMRHRQTDREREHSATLLFPIHTSVYYF